LQHQGIAIAKELLDFDLELEWDIDQLDLQGFMQLFSQLCQLKDLEVQEVPIEEIIKEIYQRQAIKPSVY
jgi:hypothetical protein